MDEAERDNQVEELLEEAAQKFTDAIDGIEILYGLKLHTIDICLGNYKERMINVTFENLGGPYVPPTKKK